MINIEEKINEILAGQQKALEEAETKISKTEEATRAAKKRAEAATAGGNLTGFRAAKSDLAAAEEALEMYRARKATLKTGHLISKDEYDEIKAAIFDKMKAASDAAKENIIPLLDQLEQIDADLAEVLNSHNALLRRLQREVWREEPRTFGSALDNQYNDYSVKLLVRDVLTSPQYEKITGKKYKDPDETRTFNWAR